MCRFNLILVKEEEAEEILLEEGYDKVNDDLLGYMAFQKGYCNCGSVVGSMSEERVRGLDYYHTVEKVKEEELNHLYEIRTFMNKPDYKEKRQVFENQRMKQAEELEVFYSHILDYELQQQDVLVENYSGKEYAKKQEEMYQKIEEMNREVEDNSEYQIKREAYQNFLAEHQLMEDSCCYYLTEEEQKEAYGEGIPLEELLGEEWDLPEEEMGKDIDRIEVEESSNVIDEVIKRKEEYQWQSEKEEFDTYEREFTQLLGKVESFLFATIWSEPGKLKQIKEVRIRDLKIDDLAFLEYDEMVCIKG